MKYQNEIESISIREKALLIKGYDSWKNSNVFGIRNRSVNISSMNLVLEKLERYGLTLTNLVATWNAELIKKALPPLMAELKAEGVNAVILEESIFNQIGLSEFVKTEFICCLIDVLQMAGISVFVEAISQRETILYTNATGFVINQVNLVKVSTDKPILVDNNGLYFIYTASCQFLSEEEILNGNRAAHGAPNGASPISDKDIDDALDKMMEVADLINKESSLTFTKDDALLNQLYQQSIVVVKNNKDLLPIVKEKRYILVTSKDITEFETYLTRNGYVCKTISVTENVQLSPSELNGYDVAIMLAVDDNIINQTAEIIKNRLLDLIIVKASKDDYDQKYLPLADAYIETFSNNNYRLYQLKRIFTGEITNLGFTPYGIESLNIPEGYSAFSKNIISYNYVNSVSNEINAQVKNTSAQEINELFVIRTIENDNIVAFTRCTLNPYEQKVLKFNVFGVITTINIDKKDVVYKDGKYPVYLSESCKFVISVVAGRLTVIQERATKQATSSTSTSSKYRLPKTHYVNDKPIIAGINISMIFLMLIAMLGALEELDLPALYIIAAIIGVIVLIAFNVFVKKNHGLSQRIVKSEDKPIAFDEIFNSKAEKTEKVKQEVITEEVLESVDAVEIDLDQVEVGIELTEQEKIISYLKEKLDINSIVDDIKEFINEVGVDTDLLTIKNLLAAMASNHTILVKSADTRLASSLIEKFGQYFTKHAYLKDLTEVNKESEILKDSKFVQTLKYAMLEAESMQVVGFNNVKAEHFESLLDKFEPFIKNHKASVKLNDTINVEKNVWLFMVLDAHESEYNLPQEILSNLVVINVDAKETIQKSVTEHLSINYYQLLKLVNDCKKDFLLQEVDWKKIDALESYVNKITPFVIGNKINTQIENFFAVLQATNIDVLDSLDLIISEKLLPIIIPILQNAVQKPEIDLVETIEHIFGEENIALALRTIRSSRLG